MSGPEPQVLTRELKSLTKNTAIYSFGNIAVKGVAFLLVPLYTHYLTVYEVGIVVLLEVLELFYSSVAALGMSNSMWRFYNPAKQAGKEAVFFSTHFVLSLVVSPIVFIFPFLFSDLIANVYLSNDESSLVRVFLIISLLGMNRIYLNSVLRILERAVPFIVLALLDFMITIVVTIICIVSLELGIWGVAYGKLASVTLISIVAFAFMVKNYGIHFDGKIAWESIKYGAPLTLSSVSYIVLTLSDRFFVKELIGVAASGIYGVCYKFGMIINMIVVAPFIQSWFPVLYRAENAPEQRLIYQRVGLYYIQVLTCLWFVITVASKYTIWFATPEDYHLGISLVPVVAFAYIVYGMENIFKAGAMLANKTQQLTAIAVAMAMTNLVLNFLFISEFGLMGAAIATVLTHVVQATCVLRLSQKHLHIPWNWRKILLIPGLGAFFCLMSVLNTADMTLEIVKDLGLFICLPLVMILLKLISVHEIKSAGQRFFAGRPI
jgi:O-antigen/teichoic acid export membrane protein